MHLPGTVTYYNDLSSYENKTFNAVPKPTV